MQRLTVKHITTYRYNRPIEFGEHRLMLRPRDSHDLRLLNATLVIEPKPKLRWLYDVFGNSVAIATFSGQSQVMKITSEILIDRFPLRDLGSGIENYASKIPFSYPANEVPDLGRTIERHYSDPDRLITEWTRRVLNQPDVKHRTEPFLRALSLSINQQFQYNERHEFGVQTPVETLEKNSGTCRDFVIFMMEAARSVGLAARFVSGYLYDPSIDGAVSDVTGAGSTHAWVQIYLPGAGWIEFDPTNGVEGARNLVPVAVAREPSQAIPVSGTFTGASEDYAGMDVEVKVHSVNTLEGAA